MFSKEIYVMEHEYYTGLSLLVMAIYAIKKLGPGLASSLDKEIVDIEGSWVSYRDESMANIKKAVEDEKNAKWENVALQLEAAYRERLATVHAEVKKRLDYQLETANVQTRIEQKHMVNWIFNNVKASITPAEEAAALKQCIANLKGLAPSA